MDTELKMCSISNKEVSSPPISGAVVGTSHSASPEDTIEPYKGSNHIDVPEV